MTPCRPIAARCPTYNMHRLFVFGKENVQFARPKIRHNLRNRHDRPNRHANAAIEPLAPGDFLPTGGVFSRHTGPNQKSQHCCENCAFHRAACASSIGICVRTVFGTPTSKNRNRTPFLPKALTSSRCSSSNEAESQQLQATSTT